MQPDPQAKKNAKSRNTNNHVWCFLQLPTLILCFKMPAKTIIFPHSAALRAKHPGHFLVSRPLSQDRISFKLLPSVCCLVPTDLLILCKLHPHWLRSPLKNVYHGKWCCVTSDFQFTMVVFTLVNCHDETRENKGDPSSIAIWLIKMGGHIILEFI